MEKQEILDLLNFDDLEILSGWQTFDANGQTMFCDIKFPSLREDILYAIADAYEENGKYYYNDAFYKNRILSMDPCICIKMPFNGEVEYNLCVNIEGENEHGEFNEGAIVLLEGEAKERLAERLSEITGAITPMAVPVLFEEMYKGVEKNVGMNYSEYWHKIQSFGEDKKDAQNFASELKKARQNVQFEVTEMVCRWAAKEMGMPYDEFFKAALDGIEKEISLSEERRRILLTAQKCVKCDFTSKDKPDKGVDRD